MKKKFKDISLEIWTCGRGVHNVRLDNTVQNQYINILSTTDKAQALMLFQDLYDVLNKHQEN